MTAICPHRLQTVTEKQEGALSTTKEQRAYLLTVPDTAPGRYRSERNWIVVTTAIEDKETAHDCGQTQKSREQPA